MFKTILILMTICFTAFGASAQTEKYTAPVKWERYAVSDNSVSILFPKLPVHVRNEDICAEMEYRRYAVYADGIAYGLNVTFDTNRKAPESCRRSFEPRRFDEKRFEERLSELTVSLKNAKTEKITRNNAEVVKVSSDFLAYWLINDFKNKRWFEIWTTDQEETKPAIKNFVESLKIEKNPAGIEIGDGAIRTLGDENEGVQAAENSEPKSNKDETKKIKIAFMPKPGYTIEARQANTQGTVRLRVVFLTSGGVGSISLVSGLPYGLTEKAIEAASKIVFIPAKRNGKNVNISNLVEYSFTIY